MRRNNALRAVAVLVVALGAMSLAFATPESKAPAAQTEQDELIILILIDALRPDHIGAYGYERPTTPRIDQLAAQSRRFTRVYANAPWTRPSTASFFTGLNASRHQTQTDKSLLPKDIKTLAERLRTLGFAAAGFSANGNGGSLGGLDKGFDLFEDPTNTYTKDVRGVTYNGLPTGAFLTQRVLQWLETNQHGKQFLFLFYVDPHDPYGAPPALEKQFLGDFHGTVRRRAVWEPKTPYPSDEQFSMVAVYDAAIRATDHAIADLIDGLVKLKRFDQTTLLISADHGEAFGEHGVYLHAHHFYDEITRIPLIAYGKRFERGVDNRLAQSIDVTQTILHLAGGKAADLPGHSLLDAPVKNGIVFSEYNEFGVHRQMVVGDTATSSYKVVWQRPADLEWFMRAVKKKEYFPSVSFDKEVITTFDLQKDPMEKVNLTHETATMPKDAQKLLDALRAFVNSAPDVKP